MSRFRLIRNLLAVGLFTVAGLSGLGHDNVTLAQDEPQGIDRPLVTFAVAGYSRISGAVETIFGSADRPELANLLNGFVTNIGDLKGWDRERPIGAMVLLNPGIAPEPVVVGFAPVADWETVLASYESGLIRIQTSTEHADRYELILPEGQQLLLRVVGDYAYFSTKPDSLDRNFVSPSRWLKASAETYDAWSTVHFSHVPEGLRTVVIDYLRASSLEKMKKQPGESDVEFEMRKFGADAVLDWFELTATDGENLTAGLKIDPETRSFMSEVVLTARPETGLATALNTMGSQRDRFDSLSSKGTPFQLSTSWVMGDHVTKMIQSALDVGHIKGRDAANKNPVEWSVIDSVHTLLTSTVADRHVNSVVRIVGHPPAQFILVGAMHFSKATDLDTCMQRAYAAIVAGSEVASVEVNVDTHQGIEIHRLIPKKYDTVTTLLYGTGAVLYVAQVGGDLWYSFGGSKAIDELKLSIDRVTAAGQSAPNAEGRILELSIDLANWLSVIPQADPKLAQTTRQAFTNGGDGLAIRVQRIDNGVQSRLTLGKGYVRLIGLLIAGAIDERRN
ncbi:MAG: hypothetical protein O2955_16220 [Planctomycetota bacterium]|nr:hypothetical protein [Planctomycetota bacterium]MDA1214061.1 hypothetical protein [Planctomycetota bacterium]